ncbi:MAG: putative copper-exporting P-type ATPase A [Methanosaeta sp. PtaB.Bin039]|nr:MAG: putative copper-exporting P-type ATPase A [Methanosaeta sp. PtaB.Bin039]
MSEKEEIFDGSWHQYPAMRTALLCGLLTISAFVLAYAGLISSGTKTAVFVLAIIVGGYSWSLEGLEELVRGRRLGIEILMLAATAGSAILGIWDEAAFLVFLYSSAEALEEYTYARSRSSIRDLLDLAPPQARIMVDGQERTVPARDLRRGDIFLVRPGEAVPTDGVIEKGSSSLDESAVTGESLPAEKGPGMQVFAGTINQEGALEVRASAAFEDNTLSKIIRLVEEAQEEKGRTQLFIERFGDRYSPLVLFCSLLVLAASHLAGHPEWAVRAVVLLVAAAPCALVISTPVAIAAGIGRAGKSGVLIKGGGHLENLGRIRAVAFDKTGTLTRGKPQVTDILPLQGDEKSVLALAYSLERLSEHPLAHAIVDEAKGLGLFARQADGFACLVGAGVMADIEGQKYYAGRSELFLGLGLTVPKEAEIERLRGQGKTAILVGTAHEVLGIIGISDQVRPGAREVVDELHRMGLAAVMLTGDSERAAAAIATELGLDGFLADLKPDQKTEAVRDLERKYGPVAMVGDGINDAPALARATVGIAMGTAGADAAIEAADVALMADDLCRIPYAVRLGRKARRISSQNIAISLLVLAILIPSALLGVLSLAAAVIFHESSELLAVANGLRVGRR